MYVTSLRLGIVKDLPRKILTLNLSYSTLFLLMTTQEAFVDSVDQDQTAQNVQSDL